MNDRIWLSGKEDNKHWENSDLHLTYERMIPYRVTCQCPECSTGELVHTGVSLPMSPPLNLHECSSCGYTTRIRAKIYPCTEYRFDPLLDENLDHEK